MHKTIIMKTAKVTEVNEVKEWGDGDRKTYYHNLTMDNGDKINIGKKSQLSVGDELNYEITDTSGQHEFSKAKSVNPDFQGGGSRQFTADPKKQASIEMQVCLKEAINYYGTIGFNESLPKEQQVVNMAKFFHEQLF